MSQPGKKASRPGKKVGQPGTKSPVAYPRRDANGRVASVREFLAAAAALLATGLVVLLAIDGLFTLAGAGKFGVMSGWLAGTLMVFLFVDDFRAWKGVPARVLVAAVGVVLGVLVGSLVNGVVSNLPNVFAGSVAVAVAGLIYVTVWFYGVRFSADRFGEGGSRPGATSKR